MSIKKLLGTAACMVIIGVSAGVSFALVQRLTTQVAHGAHAQTAAEVQVSKAADIVAKPEAEAQTFAAKSDVILPVLIAPQANALPEPPLLRYLPVRTDDAARVSPDLQRIVRLDDEIVVDPMPQIASVTPAAKAYNTDAVASVAPLRFAPAGSSMRFRGHDNKDSASDDNDGIFEQIFPARTVTKPRRTVRPTPARAVRSAQRVDRLRRLWAIGVYR